MKKVSNQALIKKARALAKLDKISDEVEVGDIGCALLTDKGNIYLGKSIVAECGIGFCAEHAAIASMLTHGEHNISKIVAVSKKGFVLPPCGRCRELMYQVAKQNGDVRIVVGRNKVVRLKALLPSPWQKK